MLKQISNAFNTATSERQKSVLLKREEKLSSFGTQTVRQQAKKNLNIMVKKIADVDNPRGHASS